jgi:ligand-binding sensor domain-containing protein/signal transduction histidine kinase
MKIIHYSSKMSFLLIRNPVLLASKFFLSVLLIILSFYVFPQSSYLRFNRITINEGLSLSSVYCTYQDNKGFMWFGTEDGLNKYDGKNFTVYRAVPGDTSTISYKWTEIIYEDQQGTLWFGSRGGLSRFDPVKETFKQYLLDATKPESLANDTITAIAEDAGNNLWIGTGGGLNRINSKTGAIERITTTDSTHMIDSWINVLLADNHGNLWIGSQTGLFYFDNESSRVSVIQITDNVQDTVSVTSLALYEDELWIGTDHGLVKLTTGSDKHVLQFVNVPPGNNQILPVIEKILFDNNGKIWVGTETGLFWYNPSDQSLTMLIKALDVSNSLSINTAKPILLDHNGTIWYGTHGSGLYRINSMSGQVDNYRNNPADLRSISENAINCIYEDRSGALWFGTFGAGISILDPQANKFEFLSHNPINPGSLSSNFIWSVYEADDGKVWIGTNDKGLNCYSPETGNFTFYDHQDNNPTSLSASSIRKVYQDSKGNIWIGTDGGGLDLFNQKTGSFTHFRHNPSDPYTISNNSVRTIYEDDSGNFWIGTREGLNKFDPETGKFKRFLHSPEDSASISHNFVYAAILKDTKGNLWIGTYGGGLNRMDIDNETFTHYLNDPDDPLSLSDNIVFSIYEDNLGMLWVGTNNGLNRLDPSTGDFIRFGVKQGLPNEVIYGILPDNNDNIWMSTNFGISRMNLSDYSITNFDVNSGLQSNEFNGGAFHLGKSGKHYWGGVYGLNIIEPEKVHPAQNQSNVVITKLEILGKEVIVSNSALAGIKSSDDNKIIDGDVNLYMGQNISYTDEIILNYSQRFISFEFNALNNPPSQKMSYSYRMEDMENDWNFSGDRNFVTYANMKPGTYIFRVNATNKDGLLSPNPAELTITINPPFWNTWWFTIIEVIALAILIIFIYIYLLNKRTNKLLTAQNQEIYAANQKLKESQKQLKELNATKDKFFSIVAHDLKNPFTSLLSISELMSKNYNSLDEEDKISSIESFHRSARRIFTLLENLLTWSRSQTGGIEFKPVDFNISELAEDCIKLFMFLADKKGIALQLHAKENIQAYGDPEMINTVLRNLLHNAIKYSNTGGEVKLDIRHEEGLVKVDVTDHGVGMTEANLKELFNLASQSISLGTGGEKGTGLGLIICKEFVEKNGGKILVRSVPDKGSTFSFYLKAGKDKRISGLDLKYL